jgi:hypothetical protein
VVADKGRDLEAQHEDTTFRAHRLIACGIIEFVERQEQRESATGKK